MGSTKPEFDWAAQRAIKPLEIIIVGAGVGGLAAGLALSRTGHHVTILEQTPEVRPAGYGVTVSPNMSLMLDHLGVLEEVVKVSTSMEGCQRLRYANDEDLGYSDFSGLFDRYKSPAMSMTRADLIQILSRAAIDSGVTIRTNQKVVAIDENFEPRVKTVEGEWIAGDLTIAADGVRSSIRRQIAAIHGQKDLCQPTGDAAYWITISGEKMEHSEALSKLLHQNVAMRWMGPGGHTMTYPLNNNTMYDMVFIHPAKRDQEESWTNKASKVQVLETFKGWSSTFRELLNCIPEDGMTELVLNIHAPMPSWIQGRVALLGDACHPMLPYVAQGAASAVEDAGVLAAVLAKTSDIDLALRVYEKARKPRVDAIQQSASLQQNSLHLPDGPEQRARDEAMKDASKGQGNNPDKYGDREWQDYMYGVDVIKQVFDEWDEVLVVQSQ